MRLAVAVCLALLATGCKPDEPRPPSARDFPRAYRPVSAPEGTGVSTEQARDDRREAATVMDLAAIEPGMTVAHAVGKAQQAAFDPADPWKALGKIGDAGLLAVFADGHSEIIPRSTPASPLRWGRMRTSICIASFHPRAPMA